MVEVPVEVIRETIVEVQVPGEPKAGLSVPPRSLRRISSPYRDKAKELVTRAELFAETTGEYKRHWVYSNLIKAYPNARKSDLGFVIEMVIQESL